jgi:hypothetical protein
MGKKLISSQLFVLNVADHDGTSNCLQTASDWNERTVKQFYERQLTNIHRLGPNEGDRDAVLFGQPGRGFNCVN